MSESGASTATAAAYVSEVVQRWRNARSFCHLPHALNIDSFEVKHTVYVGNDNDFLATFNGQDNPNQFFAFAFDDVDLPFYEPQRFHDDHERDN
jgi:hypothetical protein